MDDAAQLPQLVAPLVVLLTRGTNIWRIRCQYIHSCPSYSAEIKQVQKAVPLHLTI